MKRCSSQYTANSNGLFYLRNVLAVAVTLLVIGLGLVGCGMFLPPSNPTASPSGTAAASETPVVTPPPTPLPAGDALACQAALDLAVTNPEQALELIEEIRGIYAPDEGSGRTNCTDERNFALQKLGEARKASNSPKATPTPTPEPEPVQAQKAWDSYVASWVTPWQTLALTALGAVLSLLILARLIALLPSPLMPPRALDWRRGSRTIRRVALWGGLILMVGATLQFLTLLARSQRTGPAALTLDPWNLFWLLLIALTGSFLFGTWIASRPRLTIVVRDEKGEAQESTTSYIIAVLSELGATPPRGVEVPRGADATGLTDATVSAEVSNKVLASFMKIIQTIFGGTPWRIAVDSTASSELSVVITRNGWSVKATTIRRSDPVLFRVHAEEEDRAGLAHKVSTEPVVVVEDFDLHKLAAAFIVATLAEHYQGYEGLCGATDWRSIGLQYLATTDHARDEKAQKSVLARAVDIDPENLLASASLMNVLYRHEPESTENMQTYATWLKTKSKKIEEMSPGMTKRGKERWPRDDLFEGHRGLFYRLMLTQLSIGMNQLAAGGQNIPSKASEGHRVVAEALVKRLSITNSLTYDLEKRLRPLLALIYYDLLALNKETEEQFATEPWMDWRKEALDSSSPAIAYSVACSYARSESASKQDIERKLALAALDPELAQWMPKDPELKKYYWDVQVVREGSAPHEPTKGADRSDSPTALAPRGTVQKRSPKESRHGRGRDSGF